LPYTLACTVKSRPGLGPTPNVNRGKKKRKRKKKKKKKKKLVVLPKLDCLATYIGYVSPICARGGIHPTTIDCQWENLQFEELNRKDTSASASTVHEDYEGFLEGREGSGGCRHF
jgi:hypothetical protein